VTRLLRTQLAPAGYGGEVASDGEDALAKLEGRYFDGMVTDICMPRMSGQELSEAVRKRSRNVEPYILVMTSRAETSLREWAARIPNLDFMEKPISLRRLLDRLAGALAGAQPGSGEEA
jgi:DNA-binding response OmpR family regulator